MDHFDKISSILDNEKLSCSQMAKELLEAGAGDLFSDEIPQLVLLGAKAEPNRIAKNAKSQLVHSCRNTLAYVKNREN